MTQNNFIDTQDSNISQNLPESISKTELNSLISAKNIPLKTLEKYFDDFLKLRVNIIYDLFRLEDDESNEVNNEINNEENITTKDSNDTLENNKFNKNDKNIETNDNYNMLLKKTIWKLFLSKENQMVQEEYSQNFDSFSFNKETMNHQPLFDQENSLLFIFQKITEILLRRKPKGWKKIFFHKDWIAFNFRFCSSAILEQTLVQYLKNEKYRNESWKNMKALIITQIQKNMIWQNIFTSSLFLNHILDMKLAIEIVDILYQSGSFVYIELASLRVGEFWKQNAFTKHASKEKQEYVSFALVLLLSNWSKDKIENSAFLQHCLLGVQTRLGSTITHVRDSACLVTEKLSLLLTGKIVHLDSKNHLEIFEKEIQNLRLSSLSPTSNNEINLQSKENIQLEVEKKIHEYPKAFDPDDEFNPDEESESSTDSLDSDSLESLSEDDGQDLEPVKPPKYLRELKSLYISKQNDTDQVDRIETGLKFGEKLIRSKPDDIDFLSRSIMALLLHLQNFNITNFENNRHAQMVALLVTSPKNCINYLCTEFYGNHVSISQRIDILEIFSDAALELSNRSIQDIEVSSQFSKTSQNSDINNEINAKIKERYPSETRIWGTMNRKESKALKNNFLPYSKDMFYQIVRNYDDPENAFRLFGEDSLLLSKLLQTLGIIIYCCGDTSEGSELSITSLNFVKIFMFQFSTFKKSNIQIRITPEHQEEESRSAIQVRRSVLQLLHRCIMCLPSYLILGDLMEEIEFFLDWLLLVSQEDSDAISRELSLSTLSTLKSKIPNNNFK